jgi:hypothetical protein
MLWYERLHHAWQLHMHASLGRCFGAQQLHRLNAPKLRSQHLFSPKYALAVAWRANSQRAQHTLCTAAPSKINAAVHALDGHSSGLRCMHTETGAC